MTTLRLLALLLILASPHKAFAGVNTNIYKKNNEVRITKVQDLLLENFSSKQYLAALFVYFEQYAYPNPVPNEIRDLLHFIGPLNNMNVFFGFAKEDANFIIEFTNGKTCHLHIEKYHARLTLTKQNTYAENIQCMKDSYLVVSGIPNSLDANYEELKTALAIKKLCKTGHLDDENVSSCIDKQLAKIPEFK
ncbi:hypothetical protein [Pseudovibrio sp. FO-BEG1]|uniref:hypothetical protein n=1 Tax=Pseudovibrio sp. (strain FO-BEG1) TaxID=911045 RepID=UPI0005A1BEF6|nr:hypothetical protein [Pseudovibrio sp. FO-BEG1]